MHLPPSFYWGLCSLSSTGDKPCRLWYKATKTAGALLKTTAVHPACNLHKFGLVVFGLISSFCSYYEIFIFFASNVFFFSPLQTNKPLCISCMAAALTRTPPDFGSEEEKHKVYHWPELGVIDRVICALKYKGETVAGTLLWVLTFFIMNYPRKINRVKRQMTTGGGGEGEWVNVTLNCAKCPMMHQHYVCYNYFQHFHFVFTFI